MKAAIALLALPWAVSCAAVLHPRLAQHSHDQPKPAAPIPANAPNPYQDIIDKLTQAAIAGKDPGNEFIAMLTTAKLGRVKTMEPTTRRGAKRQTFYYGPYPLAGRGQPRPKDTEWSLDPNGQSFMEVIRSGLCQNCTVLTGRTFLAYEDGTEAGPSSGVYIHHIIANDITKNQSESISKCAAYDNGTIMVDPNNPYGAAAVRFTIGAEFITQGEDSGHEPFYFTSMDGKYESGFEIGPNDTFTVQADLVNYNNETRNVYVAFDLEYIEGVAGLDAVSSLMAITGCELFGKIKLDPKGPVETMSNKFPVLKDGVIVAARGHMHDGGDKLAMHINGQEVCVSVPTYGPGGGNNYQTIISMTDCPNVIRVKKGDWLQISSIYDLLKHPMRTGATTNALGMADVMGNWLVTFVPDRKVK